MGTILVSTHRLPVAGRLRDAFRGEGYRVEILPDPSYVADADDARLLVLTGSDAAQSWVGEAREQSGIPVFMSLPGADAVAEAEMLGVEEVFGPDTDAEEVALQARRTIERRHLQQVIGVVGESEAMREALERVVQIAPVSSTVLITGESGTGKELVARGIHALSPRRHQAFLAINMTALPEALLESELFGHEKGAFTGAVDSRKGFFELAHRGTLFLDEIGDMPLTTQTKLLRVLEQREFLRVGGEKPIHVDLRIITATNQDLRARVAAGEFRRDLFYRLNVLDIELPPLRKRRDDIPRLVAHFVRELTERLDRSFPGISDPAMQQLVGYGWPGNVRELRNLVESMVVLAPKRPIGPDDIPEEIRSPQTSRRLLPAQVSGAGDSGFPVALDGADDKEIVRPRPELEFVFRALVELRVDMDDLRREFDAYRRERAVDRLEAPAGVPLAIPGYSSGEVEVGVRSRPGSGAVPIPPEGASARADSGPDPAEAAETEHGQTPEERTIPFPQGMTMEQLERAAIETVLGDVGGRRRKAAQNLGIGERTLYRKIKKYGLDL